MKVGDVVVLKSGGPNMTITYAGGSEGKVDCSWFNKDGGNFTVHSHVFRIDALILAKAS